MGRIESGELSGFTTTHILAETAHQLMTLEAMTVLNWPTAGIGNRLRTHPAEVSRLSHFRQAIEEIVQSKLQIILPTGSLLATAVALSQQIGLLINDGLIVAVMQANGLTNLASNDSDFDRVPGLTRFAPL
jgi:predicted nucleic acid-binding protein